jgi:GT2 family glycosyltransferase
MVFGQETLERLLSAKLPIVSALYYGLHKETGETFPVANTKKGKLSREDLEAWPDNLVSVFGTGMGCCLVRRDVYKKLGVRKFWPYSEETLYGMYCDQDVVFCNRAASAGFPVYIQRDNVVGHVKTGIVWG